MPIFEGDSGWRLSIDMKINTSNAAVGFPIVKLKKPDGTFLVRGASNEIPLIMTDKANGVGYVQFTSAESIAGVWNGQTKIDWQDGGRSFGGKFTFSIDTVLT